MNAPRKTLGVAKFLLLAGGLLSFVGCVTDASVGVDTGVYYGPYHDPWFHEGPWVDGHRWYREPAFRGPPAPRVNAGVYIHPPRVRHR